MIHEFEKTTKFPTFLKTSTSISKQNPPLEFVDGKGWVDEEGNVVEAARIRPAPPKSSKPPKSAPEEEATVDSSSTDDSSSDEDASLPASKAKTQYTSGSEEEASDLDESGSGEDAGRPTQSHLPSSPLASKSDSRPKSSGSMRNLTIKIPPAESPATPAATKIHPLEALYKRPKNEDGTAAPASDGKGFTFFGSADVDEEEGDAAPAPSSQPPMTPYTRQEFEVRNIRSAAPTPDTAHPSRTFKPWAHDDAEDNLDEESEEDGDNQDAAGEKDETMEDAEAQPSAQGDQSTSDFQSWFWEHRGDLNRSWKKRRKLMSKEKRYRENKARADRAI